MYSDSFSKFVAVLNRTVDPAKLMNALAHCSSGGGALYGLDRLNLQPYEDASGSKHNGISKFPWIILQAKNSSQLASLRDKAIEAGVHTTDFVHTMLGGSAEQQLRDTKEQKGDEFTYFAVCLFGEASIIDPLTKRFSVFAVRPAEGASETPPPVDVQACTNSNGIYDIGL